jgi:outer membrane protein OmpA-like peptidoglycan-associated protein
MTRYRLIALLLASALARTALAQEVRLFSAEQTVDAHEVARILGRRALAAPAAAGAQEEQADELVRTRSLRMVDQAPGLQGLRLMDAPAEDGPPVPRIAEGGTAGPSKSGRVRPPARPSQSAPADPTALALPVQFGFDSADILPAARAQLDALAEGIKLLAPELHVAIGGHTDAAGTEEYNMALSQRRAAAVKQYLVKVHGIDGERLRAVGFGKSQPLEGRDPRAVENRRVQFHGA